MYWSDILMANPFTDRHCAYKPCNKILLHPRKKSTRFCSHSCARLYRWAADRLREIEKLADFPADVKYEDAEVPPALVMKLDQPSRYETLRFGVNRYHLLDGDL